MESTTAVNLSPSCRTRNLRIGVAVLAGGLLIATVLAKLGVYWAWRLLLVLPFLFASHAFLQGLYGT
ncbi:MAG: hypothetical protein L6Q84_25835 [Polyangiaceae bacterium]|nr:hypothetical protein [Polyangiaceae bacterium]